MRAVQLTVYGNPRAVFPQASLLAHQRPACGNTAPGPLDSYPNRYLHKPWYRKPTPVSEERAVRIATRFDRRGRKTSLRWRSIEMATSW